MPGIDDPIGPDEFTDDISPEAAEKLFKAIVLQSLYDACMTLPEHPPSVRPADWVKSPRSKKSDDEAWSNFVKVRLQARADARRIQDDARKWLLHEGKAFAIVCNMAGWEPDYVRRGAKRLAEQGWPERRVRMIALALERTPLADAA